MFDNVARARLSLTLPGLVVASMIDAYFVRLTLSSSSP
jgi:hypothetical protein